MADRMWYYLFENEQIGPVSCDELMQMLQQGTLAPHTYVWSEGLAQWQLASAIPELGGIPLADGRVVPLRVRPTSVTVFGILNIVFGGLGILCLPIAIGFLFLPKQPGAIEFGPAMMAYSIVGYIVGFFCSILLVATGIGLLRQKLWARQWTYGYGWFAIVWGVIGFIISIIILTTGMGFQAATPEQITVARGSLTMGMCFNLIGLVYPVLLVIFMKRPNVIEACQC